MVRRVDDAWGAGRLGDPSSQETLVQHPFIAGNLRQSTHGPFLPSAGEDREQKCLFRFQVNCLPVCMLVCIYQKNFT